MTSRFRFSVDTENEETGRTTFSNTTEFDAELIGDVIGNFELFLKGAGFVFHGHVDITEEPTINNSYENSPVDNWPDPAYDTAYTGGDLDLGSIEQADITIKRPDNTEGGTLD
jgi:hypothetical protein